MTNERLPRLGDRKDLVIEVTPSAVSIYRQSYARAFAGARSPTRGATLTDAEAREELAELLREAKVTYSAGETMHARAAVRRLEVDMQAELTRVSPTHVRCYLAVCRRLDTTKAARNKARVGTRQIHDEHGRKIGFLRVAEDGQALEYRPTVENGQPAAPWVPIPEHVRMLLVRGERNQATRAWIEKQNLTL